MNPTFVKYGFEYRDAERLHGLPIKAKLKRVKSGEQIHELDMASPLTRQDVDSAINYYSSRHAANELYLISMLVGEPMGDVKVDPKRHLWMTCVRISSSHPSRHGGPGLSLSSIKALPSKRTATFTSYDWMENTISFTSRTRVRIKQATNQVATSAVATIAQPDENSRRPHPSQHQSRQGIDQELQSARLKNQGLFSEQEMYGYTRLFSKVAC